MVHLTAEIADDAQVDAGTRVWDYARIREGAVIGRDCIIGRGAYIDAGVLIGDRVKIQNNALVYHGVTVATGVFIGPGVILTNDRYPRSTVEGRLAGTDDWTVSETQLREGCSIGAGAIVVAGNDIGRFATVGAGSVITRSGPDHGLVTGNPGRLMGWVCACGQRLVDEQGQPIDELHEGLARCPRDDHRFDVRRGVCHDVVAA
jgi:UDP-2-acetamido-3-amino-2,3-dideoxy-glucuronate N-acetyltransferase